MSGNSTYRALGILIESFSDFLQRIFEGNGQVKLDKEDLKNSLKRQAHLEIDDLLFLPWLNLQSKLDKVDTKTLDQVILYLYGKVSNENKRSRTTDLRILDLIKYLDTNRTEFSLDRNNIKNSLQHNL
ncbi:MULTISPECIES: hypothetical protein [unclassified Maribacter]|uniref:hypothetical protein n=1 Tax=unclassified Maribacter TaxID=2615042 RepID=UPI00257CC105|nr:MULTISPECIES: hypothetical protein [unclassified Maribacter]|tara:strand:- start:1257 stop:1640 length:384 start_codon:yes stop_codon:yes gene_type:complete